jgi:hypothetical protein
MRTTEIEQSACPKNVGVYEVLQGKFKLLKINDIHKRQETSRATLGIKVQTLPGAQDTLWVF